MSITAIGLSQIRQAIADNPNVLPSEGRACLEYMLRVAEAREVRIPRDGLSGRVLDVNGEFTSEGEGGQ